MINNYNYFIISEFGSRQRIVSKRSMILQNLDKSGRCAAMNNGRMITRIINGVYMSWRGRACFNLSFAFWGFLQHQKKDLDR